MPNDLDKTADRELAELDERAHDELLALGHDELVKKYLDLQRAYVSALNAVMLFKRQLSALRDHTLRSGQIADLSRKVNIADIDVIGQVAVQEVPHFFQAERGALFLYDQDADLLTLRRCSGGELEQPALHMEHDSDTLLVRLLKTRREPLAVAGFEEYERSCGRELRQVPLDALLEGGALVCPLVIGIQEDKTLLVGALVLSGRAGGFSRQDEDMAAMMSEMFATAISTSRLIEQMSHLAETDGLTQMYNHRHFQQELDRAIASAKRYGSPLCVAMLDIDFFKKFNDTHGHQAGDHVLREVGRVIRMTIRDQLDVAARYGGEEFAIIMPSTGMPGALIAAERLRFAVENAGITIAGARLRVTVSAGLAEYAKGEPKSALVDRADAALYRAKSGGRNRVESSAG